jgi:hypothetical protein
MRVEYTFLRGWAKNPSLVFINTLMIQNVLLEPQWAQQMTPEDLRALTPLIYAHINPYGSFNLNMDERLTIERQ